MSTQHELKLQEQLQAREEESVKKDQEILTLKDQMQQMAVTMQQQMEMMEQLKLQLKGTPKGASKATVEEDKEIEKEARREEAKTVEIMKLAVPVLEWGGKNFELWEESGSQDGGLNRSIIKKSFKTDNSASSYDSSWC